MSLGPGSLPLIQLASLCFLRPWLCSRLREAIIPSVILSSASVLLGHLFLSTHSQTHSGQSPPHLPPSCQSFSRELLRLHFNKAASVATDFPQSQDKWLIASNYFLSFPAPDFPQGSSDVYTHGESSSTSQPGLTE